MVGQPFQHREARFLLPPGLFGGEGHDLARRMLAIDEGALQSEVDEADRDALLPDRDLAQ
ncbi:hypothetical protein D3C87_1974610 [compost metagenome]